MIVGKNSAKKGFTWYLDACLKLIVSVATIAHIEKYPIVGVIGITALLYFGYTSWKEYKSLES